MKKRYFLAHIPVGQFAAYHRALVHNVAAEFQFKTSAGYFPTHITLKAPFEATQEQVDDLKRHLSLFSEEHRAFHQNLATFTVYGFGHLGRKIITLDVVHSTQMDSLVSELQKSLRRIEWVTWKNHEPIFHFHITLVKGISENFNEVWEFLRGKTKPRFSLSFNNIALLRFEDGAWVVDGLYLLNL